MEDIAKGQIGDIGQYDLDLKEGKLIASASASMGGGIISSSHKIELDAGKLLDFIASKIPGTLDDMVLGMAKEALKKV